MSYTQKLEAINAIQSSWFYEINNVDVIYDDKEKKFLYPDGDSIDAVFVDVRWDVHVLMNECPSHPGEFYVPVADLLDAQMVIECEYCDHLCNPKEKKHEL